MDAGLNLVEETRKNPTVEKWEVRYKNKFADEAKTGGVRFKDLDVHALRAEKNYYEAVVCETKKGSVSIGMLLAEEERIINELFQYDEKDEKEVVRECNKKLKKTRHRIVKHPMYRLWHATYEVIRAVEKLEKMSEDNLSQVI